MKTKIITKVLSATLALSMAFGVGVTAIGNTSLNPFVLSVSAADTMTANYDGITYEYSIGENGLTIISAKGDFKEDYIIPEKINGINVKAIGKESFKGQNVKNITIPSEIVFLGNRAFVDCVSLKTVYFNAEKCSTITPTYAGAYNFFGGSTLSKIIFGENVSEVPDNLCINAGNLETVIFKERVTNIGESAFENCTSLKSIETYTENGIEKKNDLSRLIGIKEYAFYGSSYQEFIAPDSLRTIGEEAFYGTPIKRLELGNITSLGQKAFANCKNLKEVTIPKTLNEKSVGFRVFYGCSKLETVYFNANANIFKVSAVDGNASNMFADSGVTKIVIGKDVTSIPERAFQTTIGSTNINKVIFSGKVSSIGKNAFYICSELDVYYPGTEAEWKSVQIEDGNDAIKNAHMHYNYVNEDTDVEPISVKLDDIALNYKASVKLNPVIYADNNANYTVEYKSSDTKVATVDENGTVYGANKGSATITCNVTDEFGNSVSDTCKVTVNYTWWQIIIKFVLFGWLWY